jgi:predicted nucleic acid-binding protein
VILADTSVWIEHFHRRAPRLAAALEWGSVFVHPFVVGELACGTLRNREVVLTLLNKLPKAPVATHDEAMAFIDTRRLMSRGIGYIDVHLLASATLSTGMRLWTLDRRLSDVAQELGIGA